LKTIEEVAELAFCGSFDLRHVTLSPDAVIKQGAFFRSLSMGVLAASVGFELDTGNKFGGGNWNDSTVGITRFTKWRNQMDGIKEYYNAAMIIKKCEQQQKIRYGPL